MIFCEDLTKKFDEFLAVDSVNLMVAPGEVLVLLGPNGAGKTTTVRMLTSILLPTRGRAVVGGFDVVKEPDKVRAAVGVLTEHHGLYGRMNAVEYLDFFSTLYSLNPQKSRKRFLDLLDQFGLGDVNKKRLGEYSKGMRQKLALVRALLHDPPVLLLDEPTSAMDPESARMVRDAILSLRSGDRTIVLCTHNLAEAEELADQVAIIRRGKIILNDTVNGIKLQLLGAAEYEAHLAHPVDYGYPDLPAGVSVMAKGADWLRLRVADPLKENPEVLRSLLDHGLDVMTYYETPRSLESAYLEAINRMNGGDQHA
jgi:ABC-2 type transport system ATP-binding protein